MPFPSPEDLPDPGIEPRSSALQVDALPSELLGKPMNSLMESETSHGPRRWTQPGPRDPCRELGLLLREGAALGWAHAYLRAMRRAEALDSYRPGLESQLCLFAV